MTDGTNFFWNLALAFAGVTNGCLLDIAKNGSVNLGNLPTTFAGITSLKFVSRLGGGALAVFALGIEVHDEFTLDSKDGFLES